MFKRLTVVVFILAFGLLIFQQIQFDVTLATLYETDPIIAAQFFQRVSQEIFIGNMITVVLLVLANVTAILTKRAQWVFLPLLFFSVLHIMNAYKGEALFHYKKSVGLWNGSFSLGPIAAFIFVALAALVIFINYTIMKNYLKKKAANNPLKS